MQVINELVTAALGELGWPATEFGVEHPRDESHGDYSANAAMIVGKQVGKNPREVAEAVAAQIRQSPAFAKNFARVEVAGPGFINFYLNHEFLLQQVQKATEPGYGQNKRLKGKKVMVEFTDPNPFKEFHIGHLMSNTIGESLARLLEAAGAEVKRACYQGDVGLHVAKSVWGWQKKMGEDGVSLGDLQGRTLKARVEYLGQAYAYGAAKYEEVAEAKTEINALNKVIYEQSDLKVNELYQRGKAWSLEYFETIYQRLGTKFDEYFFESETGKIGLMVVEEGLKKKVLTIGEEGAVVYRGESEGLHTRVFRNRLGLPTYEAKDLGLAKAKYARYPYDLSYIVTANEITEYFRVVLRVMEQLYPDLRAKTTHLPHGMMKLLTGKMSSRSGKVITGEGLLNELKTVVEQRMEEGQGRVIEDREKVTDQVAVAALKYTILKQAVGGDIVYEPEKMTNLEGNTGPYLQYTYARAKSVLAKAKVTEFGNRILEIGDSKVETSLLRWIYRYPEVIEEAGVQYAPHLLATYLAELSARFNTFYNQELIGDNPGRLQLTLATSSILQSGLGVLGIEAPESM